MKLYELPPSPNNMKVRAALGFKGLSFERVPVDPMDRRAVIEVSGQPLTPVLVDGDCTLFDSAAIIRYLEANYPETPSLFSTDYEEFKAIEAWERRASTELSQPGIMIFRQRFTGRLDPGADIEAQKLAIECTAQIEEALEDSDWLCGDRLTAADIFCYPWVWYMSVPEDRADLPPIAEFIRERLSLGEGRERTLDWARRVAAYDA